MSATARRSPDYRIYRLMLKVHYIKQFFFGKLKILFLPSSYVFPFLIFTTVGQSSLSCPGKYHNTTVNSGCAQAVWSMLGPCYFCTNPFFSKIVQEENWCGRPTGISQVKKAWCHPVLQYSNLKPDNNHPRLYHKSHHLC